MGQGTRSARRLGRGSGGGGGTKRAGGIFTVQ